MLPLRTQLLHYPKYPNNMDFIFRVLTNGTKFKIQQKTDDGEWHETHFPLFNSYQYALMYLEIFTKYLDFSDKTEGDWEEVKTITI